MNIYFARSLRGDRTPGDEALYKGIAKAIKAAGHHTQFETPVHLHRDDYSCDEEYIYWRDLKWIDQCQAMVAEVTTVSHGVGYEIAYAKHVCHIPIFCCCSKDTLVSAMITGDLEVLQYRDLGDLTAYIEAFLQTIHV